MFCSNCGKEISDGVNVCPHCNKPVSTSAMLNEKAKQTLNFATEKAQSFTKDFQENIKSGNYKNFLNKKNIIAVAAVLLVFIIAANLFGGRKSIKPVIRELEKINTADARAWSAFVKENGINAITSDNMTLLHNAVLSQNESLVKACIKAGADPNRTTIYNPPLMVAISSNNYKITEMLLKAGANVRGVKDANLVTLVLTGTEYDAMSTAVGEEYFDIVKLLLPYYKKAKLLDNSDSEFRWIYADWVSTDNYDYDINHEIVEALLESGFRPSISDMHTLIEYGFFHNEEDKTAEYYWKNVITKFCPDKKYKNKIVDEKNNLLTAFYGSTNYERFLKYMKYMIGLGYDTHTETEYEDKAIEVFISDEGLPLLGEIIDLFIANKMSLPYGFHLLGLIEDNIEKSNTIDEANKWFAYFNKIVSSLKPSSNTTGFHDTYADGYIKKVNDIMEVVNNPSLPFIDETLSLKPLAYYNVRNRFIGIRERYDVNCIVLVKNSLNGKSPEDIASEYDYDIMLLIHADDKNPNAWTFPNNGDSVITRHVETIRKNMNSSYPDTYDNKYHFAISEFEKIIMDGIYSILGSYGTGFGHEVIPLY